MSAAVSKRLSGDVEPVRKLTMTAQILRYVQQCEDFGKKATISNLFQDVGLPMMGPGRRKEFTDRLHGLCKEGRMLSEGTHRSRLFFPAFNEPLVPTAAVAATKRADADANEPLNIVPPNRIDRLHGPVWVPKAQTNSRPGADDFLRCPSVGNRC